MSEQQPRAGEVWGDPADTWSWARVHSCDSGMVYFQSFNSRGLDVYMVADFVRNRQCISPPPAEPASEWPDGAPEGATELRCDFDGCMYFKIPLNTCFGRGIKTVNYTGPAPASWAGKPWNECVIYRPRPEGRGS